jgi:glycosyltransferase involved in cell wall biosynthesis
MKIDNIYVKLIIKNIIIILFLIVSKDKIFFSFNINAINTEQRLLRFIKRNKKDTKNNDIKEYLNSVNEYINLIQNKTINYVYYRNEIKNPKITFVSTVYNKEKYLNPLIVSVQNQKLIEFEIIFIDDYSSDNSVNIINNFSKIDKRIKLIKNKKNKGTLYSRSQGAIHSKGEYIIFIDSDDLVLKNGLYNSYNYIKTNNLSMVQFNTIFKRNQSLSLSIRYYKYKKIVKQPILSYLFYYNENTKKGDELNTALWDKLINKNITLKAIQFIGKNYLKETIKIENDVILLFSLFQVADTYQYINETGYFYIRNHNDSITNSWKDPKISNSIIHGLFTNIKFFYQKTGNSFLDKNFCFFKLKQSFNRYIICFRDAKKEYNFVLSVIHLLLDSPYISKKDKIIISNIEISLINLVDVV